MGFRDLEEKLKGLASITQEAAADAAESVDQLIKSEFDTAVWPALKPSSIKRRGHNKPPLVDTEHLKQSLNVQVISYNGQIDIRVTLEWYQIFHQATNRPIIANKDKLETAISEAIQKAFNKPR